MSNSAAASSSSLKNFYKQEKMGDREQELAAVEGTFAYHTICHNHSFRSMDCTSKLLQVTFEPKFTCARTKAEAIILNVFMPYALRALHNDLEKCSFVSILTDASNHKETKLFPILVRYIDWSYGVRVKILEFKSLPGETSDIVSDYLITCLEKNNLKEKVIGLCADNTNSNFGGANRRGENNVFVKLKRNLNHDLIGVGCAAHIIHNTIRTSADILPVDIEMIISKIYLYFKSYTVRVETLKNFCNFVETDFSMILGYSQTRWLALLPAIGRVLEMFLPLKAYFQSQEKCPMLILKFFENPVAEAWLHFIYTQASIFHKAITTIENQTSSIFDVIASTEKLKASILSRIEDNFIPTSVKKILEELEENGDVSQKEVIEFREAIVLFYQTALTYLEKWTKKVFQEMETYSWIILNEIPSWSQFETAFLLINKMMPNHKLSETDIYEEYVYLKKYITEEKILEWSMNKTSPVERWMEISAYFNKNQIPCSNVLKLPEFFFCLPGTNAATERVFSIMNTFWTSDKTQLKVDTLKGMLITKINFDENCSDFYKKIKKEKDVLINIHASEKYHY